MSLNHQARHTKGTAVAGGDKGGGGRGFGASAKRLEYGYGIIKGPQIEGLITWIIMSANGGRGREKGAIGGLVQIKPGVSRQILLYHSHDSDFPSYVEN